DSGWIGTIVYAQTDLTSLLPVWACIMEKDQAVGVLQNMVEKYRSTVGLVTQPSKYSSTGDNIGNSISMFWNGLFIETLLDHGLYDQAVNITKSLLDGASQALAHTGCLGGLYHPETGSIIGTADTLDGLFPISIFLKILGIQKLTLEEVIISGFNPFPAPIEVKYRTLSILCSKNETKVTQYNKPPVIINNSGIHRLIF
ncbi:MAG: hypothetical protein HGA86_08345, partial [Anaerolineaceae bacterium]|nr:hypothetical protein [Anaerolineaceae bacterium]